MKLLIYSGNMMNEVNILIKSRFYEYETKASQMRFTKE